MGRADVSQRRQDSPHWERRKLLWRISSPAARDEMSSLGVCFQYSIPVPGLRPAVAELSLAQTEAERKNLNELRTWAAPSLGISGTSSGMN